MDNELALHEKPARHIIIRKMTKLAVSTTDCQLRLDPIESRFTIRWNRIAGRDLTNSPTLTELYLARGSELYLMRASAQGAAARSVHLETSVTAPGDYVPLVRVVGATADDEIELYAFGEVV